MPLAALPPLLPPTIPLTARAPVRSLARRPATAAVNKVQAEARRSALHLAWYAQITGMTLSVDVHAPDAADGGKKASKAPVDPVATVSVGLQCRDGGTSCALACVRTCARR